MKETEIDIQVAHRSGGNDGPEQDQLTIEEAFSQLEQLVARLEGGEASLEQSFSLYQEGMKLAQLCGQKINGIEKQLIMVDESEETNGF